MAVDENSMRQEVDAFASQMAGSREREAVTAYFAFLAKRGAKSSHLKQRIMTLVQLDPFLHEISADGIAYREAVENMLTDIPRQQWPYCLAVVREFFLFWTQNFKLIAKLSSEEHFDLELAQWQALQGDLKALWTRLDKDALKDKDARLLASYSQALYKRPQLLGAIETRAKLAKLLLVRLADTPNRTPKIYRKAVDATVPVFEMREMRFLFLDVVRELFYFWIEDPEAAEYMLRARTDDSALGI